MRPKKPNYRRAKRYNEPGETLANRRAPLLKQLTVTASGKRRARFWQGGGGYDLNIWNMEKVLAKADYCHHNPVKRGLVRNADQWKWSSFRWQEMGKRSSEPLALDSWAPW